MKAIHLCCGAGGTTLGFERAGISTAYAFDVDPFCVQTHQANFSNAICEMRDIREMQGFDWPAADVWTCGIPCEPFSRSGLQLQDADPRDLSIPLASLIKAVVDPPRFVFLENVPPYEKTLSATIVRCALRQRGYRFLEAIFNHADFGVPQARRRWHLVASRDGWPVILESTHSEMPDLFGRQLWQRFGTIRDEAANGYLSAIALRGIFRRTIRNAVKYGNAWAPTVVDDDDMMPVVLSAWRARINSTTPLIYDDGRLRAPTFLEAVRAQGFPEGFEFLGNSEQRWRQVGQAVPPLFAEAVARAMLSAGNVC